MKIRYVVIILFLFLLAACQQDFPECVLEEGAENVMDSCEVAVRSTCNLNSDYKTLCKHGAFEFCCEIPKCQIEPKLPNKPCFTAQEDTNCNTFGEAYKICQDNEENTLCCPKTREGNNIPLCVKKNTDFKVWDWDKSKGKHCTIGSDLCIHGDKLQCILYLDPKQDVDSLASCEKKGHEIVDCYYGTNCPEDRTLCNNDGYFSCCSYMKLPKCTFEEKIGENCRLSDSADCESENQYLCGHRGQNYCCEIPECQTDPMYPDFSCIGNIESYNCLHYGEVYNLCSNFGGDPICCPKTKDNEDLPVCMKPGHIMDLKIWDRKSRSYCLEGRSLCIIYDDIMCARYSQPPFNSNFPSCAKKGFLGKCTYAGQCLNDETICSDEGYLKCCTYKEIEEVNELTLCDSEEIERQGCYQENDEILWEGCPINYYRCRESESAEVGSCCVKKEYEEPCPPPLAANCRIKHPCNSETNYLCLHKDYHCCDKECNDYGPRPTGSCLTGEENINNLADNPNYFKCYSRDTEHICLQDCSDFGFQPPGSCDKKGDYESILYDKSTYFECTTQDKHYCLRECSVYGIAPSDSCVQEESRGVCKDNYQLCYYLTEKETGRETDTIRTCCPIEKSIEKRYHYLTHEAAEAIVAPESTEESENDKTLYERTNYKPGFGE